METSDSREARRRREDRAHPYFSCAFCNANEPKPFKICKDCGEQQPKGRGKEQ